MKYPPWKITDCLYEDIKVRILKTTDKEWVIKTPARDSEINMICTLSITKPRHAVMLPPIDRICGRNWYAMKRYDGTLQSGATKVDWRRVARQVLQFLQDFHHKTRMCHNDIKLENIYVDKNNFVVGDFGDATKPSQEILRNKNYEHIWHYITMGAELGEPVHGWRLDLVALGYMLAKLTLDRSHYTFQKECANREANRPTMTDAELFALRRSELHRANPVILGYLNRVASLVPWASTAAPPPRSVYRELEAMFVDTKVFGPKHQS